jgi:type IV secretory pathway VirB10-like protein
MVGGIDSDMPGMVIGQVAETVYDTPSPSTWARWGAADQGGYAGFRDQVNAHFWPKIGNALLISIADAGVQLSQPQGVNGQNYNSRQIAAAALGQQFGELGQEYARAPGCRSQTRWKFDPATGSW